MRFQAMNFKIIHNAISAKYKFPQRVVNEQEDAQNVRLSDSTSGPISDDTFPNGKKVTHNFVDHQLTCLIIVVPIDVLAILNLNLKLYFCLRY